MREERTDFGELIETLRELAKEIAELERELVGLVERDMSEHARYELIG